LARPEGHNYNLVCLEERNLYVEQKDPKPLLPDVAFGITQKLAESKGCATRFARTVLAFVFGFSGVP
jgi:hypothetical protein